MIFQGIFIIFVIFKNSYGVYSAISLGALNRVLWNPEVLGNLG
jgi:hypothetical protein